MRIIIGFVREQIDENIRVNSRQLQLPRARHRHKDDDASQGDGEREREREREINWTTRRSKTLSLSHVDEVQF